MTTGEEKSEKSRKEAYDEGYEAAKKDFTDIKDKCIEFYTDGYKDGFKDGYKAAVDELIKRMPPETRQRIIEESAEKQWPPWW